ncbi:hypothetical protein [Rhodococcus sp. Q]|uniref:hypothetical protein n=1 Tax=Rhodococcus sp. Q TaxID=2502252 RepID=UPI0010F913D9|nr:hypothetical protein [Rhodococcus sp. Q]
MSTFMMIGLVVIVAGALLTLATRRRALPIPTQDGRSETVWPSIGLTITGLGALLVAIATLVDPGTATFGRVAAVLTLLILAATAVFVAKVRLRRH